MLHPRSITSATFFGFGPSMSTDQVTLTDMDMAMREGWNLDHFVFYRSGSARKAHGTTCEACSRKYYFSSRVYYFSEPAVLGFASLVERTTGGMAKVEATGRVSAQAEEFR